MNNNTFASYTVRCGFHKFFLSFNNLLLGLIDKFAEFQESRNHVIDDTVLVLLQEDDMYMSEYLDVPKVSNDDNSNSFYDNTELEQRLESL